MEKSEGAGRKKLWILVAVATLAVLLIIAVVVAFNKDKSKTTTKSGEAIYNVKVTSTKVNDMSDWEIKGTTSAPDGAKLFATYGDEPNSEEYGINAASSTSLTSWATVRNGKFTMFVNPLILHYEKEYKSGKSMNAYLFAVTGLNGKLSNYNIEPKISKALKSAIAKNIKKTKLNISSSQASYYNSLATSDDESSSDNEPSESSASLSESSSSASSSSVSDNASDYQTGITYDQIARNPNDYKDKKVQFTGKVIQVIEDDDQTEIRIAVDGNSDNVILVDYDNDILSGSRVLENDVVTVSGKSVGTVSYKSTMGGKITIPGISATILTDQGKASDDYGE